MTKIITLFDTNIEIKDNLCVNNANMIQNGENLFNLYIKITDYCNALCKFCSNSNSEKNEEIIDLKKLETVILELKKLGILNRVSITGGEPFLYIDRLNKLLNKLFEIDPNLFITINTNGINYENIYKLDSLDKIEGIHISRHHYDDSINDNIFGVKTASIKDLDNLKNKILNDKLIRLNSLLMKDYINNEENVSKYLDIAGMLDVFRVGFVSLMKINDYSKTQFIDFNDIFNENLDSRFLRTLHMYDKNVCECTNGMYLSESGNLVEYYARMTKDLNCPYTRQFVYTSNNELSVGFNKEKIKIK